MSIRLHFSPRFERKIDLLDNSVLPRIRASLAKLEASHIDALLKRSRKMLTRSGEPPLLIVGFAVDYRIIFRRIGKEDIELLDIVAHDDLNKFLGMLE
jgi:hypothetical protein